MADATSGKTFGKVIQKRVFRTKEKVLQNLGKADRTTDDDFMRDVAAFNEQQAVLSKLQKEVKHYQACVKEISLASQNMYRAVKEAYEPEWVGYTELTAAVEQLSSLWEDYQAKVNEQLQDHISSYANHFPEVKARIAKRNRKLTDYDRARHEYEAQQTAKKQDEVKLNRAFVELNEAKHVYEDINSDLHQVLPALYQSRVPFTASLVNTLCSVEALFQHESAKVKDYVAEATNRLCAETGEADGSTARDSVTTGFNATSGYVPDSSANRESAHLNNSQPNSPAPDNPGLEQHQRPESNVSDTSGKDASPALSPRIITPSVDTGIPQSPIAYNGESAEHVQVTPVVIESPVVTESSPAPCVKPTLSGRDSESDGNTTKELTNADTSASADMSPKVDVDVGLSNNKDGSDVEDREKTASRLSATALLGQDVVPEHRVLFRVLATHKYVGEDVDELTFEPGEIITVVPFDDPEEQDDGWLMGVKESSKEKGVFPENFTRRL